jgi:predicted RNA-binding Zn-ribbon protein involved in translation (DUF1610 family)
MKPRILLFDIETSPHLSWNWGKYEQNALGFKTYGHLLCFAWKWLGEKETHVLGLPTNTERQLLLKLAQLFDEADVVVAHNGRSFDIKMVNGYLVHAKIKPPSPFKIVDTKEVAKRHFRFVSNKLDDLGDYLGLGRKIQTGGMELWFDCMAGKQSAWKKMLSYNKQDVVLLEKVYLRLRPWMDIHPNYGIYTERFGCPNCGSRHVQARGTYVTRVAKYQRYQCQDCGAWCKGEREKIHVVLR